MLAQEKHAQPAEASPTTPAASSPASMQVLRAQNISKTYGSLKALDDVSFFANNGEAVGVIGPNGAGKTTLFGALAGSFPVSAGQIEFNGQNVTTSSAEVRSSLGIARTYQVPKPFLGLTVFENVRVASRAGGGKDAQESVEHTANILEQTGLIGLANTPAAAIGLLDRKRLEVARALATSPEIILLDEIGGGLTEAEMVHLVRLVNDLKESGLTVVWIEHILNALMKVVTRLVCMAEGRVLAEGDPEEVMSHPDVKSAYIGSAAT